MKLFILLSIAALASCEYQTATAVPTHSYAAPDAAEPAEPNPSPSSVSFDPPKSFFNFGSFYKGAFPPSTIPHSNFLSTYSYPTYPSYRYPFRNNYYVPLSGSPQVVLPPISQVIPPISQVIPPIFGNSGKPSLPVNPSVVPPVAFPPQIQVPQVPQVPAISQTAPIPFSAKPAPITFPKFNYYNYAFPSYYNTLTYPYFNSPFSFPTTFSAAPTTATKEPAKTQEPLSNCYGTPASKPAESSAPFEPEGPAETSAPFEPAPVSYPYEPAVPETPEEAPHKPAQEYGPPSK